jgi:hypothetical protein
MDEEHRLPEYVGLRTYAESPAVTAFRLYADSPAAKALGTYANSPAAKALLAFADGPATKALETYAKSPAAKALQSYSESPAAQMLETSISPIAHGNFSFPGTWEIELAKRAAALGPSWEIGTNSAVGFAKLAHLSEAANYTAPYSQPVRELFEAELGNSRAGGDENTAEMRDEAAIAAGLRPELIAFPSSNFPSIVIAAGFKLLLPTISVPQAIESADSSAAYEAGNFDLLYSVEQRLRDSVESKLLGIVGPAWVRRRVPEAVRGRWQQRQSEERELRRTVYGLIQYADFAGLADVITRADNWNEVFQHIFLNKDDFRMSLARLNPIRRAIAHCRPLGRADVLTLVAEGARILSALGVATLT